jgi:hypothetical protein
MQVGLDLVTTTYYQLGICTGQAINKFPAFINTSTLCAIFKSKLK